MKKRDPFDSATVWIGISVAGVIAYLLYQKYRDLQRAQAHPIVIPSDSSLLQKVSVNPNLVSDAVIINS